MLDGKSASASLNARLAARAASREAFRNAIADHAKACPVRVEMWKLIALAALAGSIGGGAASLAF